MLQRKQLLKIQGLLHENAIVLLEGALGTGKTTLVKNAFPDYSYVSMKDKKQQNLLELDPRRFFSLYAGKTIFDDIEFVDDFCQLLCTYSMSIYQSGNYLLLSSLSLEIGSNPIAKVNLFFPDFQELRLAKKLPYSFEQLCFSASFDSKVGTYSTYQKQLVRDLLPLCMRVHEPELFSAFISLLATQVDLHLNLNELAKKLKLTQPTIEKWLKILVRMGIVFLLEPLDERFGKRHIKSPKLYFQDTAFACYLLKIKTSEKLLLHSKMQAIYCNLLISEFYKKFAMEQSEQKLYFWKESNGHEVKLVVKNPTSFDVYEITTKHELKKDLMKELDLFDSISDGKVLSKNVIYGGYKNQLLNEVNLISWQLL